MNPTACRSRPAHFRNQPEHSERDRRACTAFFKKSDDYVEVGTRAVRSHAARCELRRKRQKPTAIAMFMVTK